jgi:hypothetical protein
MRIILSTNPRYFPKTKHVSEESLGDAKRRLQSRKVVSLDGRKTEEKRPKGERIVAALERRCPRLLNWLTVDWDGEFKDRWM